MKHIHKFTALTLCAAMLLSGCNTGTPAVTSTVAEEVTTTAAVTAEVTTTAAVTAEVTTTTSVTTTAQTSTAKTETAKKYIVYCSTKPFDSKALEIFEKAFCGSWKCTDTRGSDARGTLTLTYTKSPFTYESWYYPCGIFETDEIYALTFINGGVCGCFVIEKAAPELMYFIAEYNGSEVSIDEHAYIYTDREYEMPAGMPSYGEISVFGWYWLENEYGGEFARKSEETLELQMREGILGEDDGRRWTIGGDLSLPVEKRILVSRTEDTVTVGMLYRDTEENERYWQRELDTAPSEKYFCWRLSRNDGGEWSVSFAELEDVYEEADTKIFTNEKNKKYEPYYPELVLNDYCRHGSSVSFASGTVTIYSHSGSVLASAPFSTGLTGLDGMSCSSLNDIEVILQTYNAKNGRALVCVFLPFIMHDEAKYLASVYWFTDGKLKKCFHSGEFEPEVSSTDSIFLNGNNMTVTDSDGIITNYEIGDTGMVNKVD
jgi:hypothetical protein